MCFGVSIYGPLSILLALEHYRGLLLQIPETPHNFPHRLLREIAGQIRSQRLHLPLQYPNWKGLSFSILLGGYADHERHEQTKED